MKTGTSKKTTGESGFILAIVLVFLVVLSLTAFFSAKLTRTDVQVVNNQQNEKEALFAAEAGVNEALYRLSLVGGDKSTIVGVAGGNPFDASLAPSILAPNPIVRDTTNGASDYGIVTTNANSTAQILFTTAAPTTGTPINVPSLEPPATSQINYTTSNSAAATGNLTIGWELCTAAQVAAGAPGCSVAGAIRQLPTGTNGRPVVKIVSTGQSGNARRTVTVRAIDCIPVSGNGNGSITTMGETCSGSSSGQLSINGGNTITAAGSIQINAGANSTDPSTCTAAQTVGGSSVTGSDIHAVGNVSGTFNPAADTGGLPSDDPYANLLPPCYTGGPAQCQGATTTSVQCASAGSPSTCTYGNNAVLNPGIYYGGIHINGTGVVLNPGVYIIAGGGFTSSNGTTSLSSAAGGVMIYNTQDASHTSGQGAIAAFDLSQGNTDAHLVAPTSGTFAGVVLYQDRSFTSSPPPVDISGGNSGRVLDGLVYAPYSALNVKGGLTSGTVVGGALVVNNITLLGSTSLTVQLPSTPVPTPACGHNAYLPVAWQDF